MTCSYYHAIRVYAKYFNNIEIRMLNQLPLSSKEIPVLYKFKRTLKAFLLDHRFYSIGTFRH
jgi:hypothetical protein